MRNQRSSDSNFVIRAFFVHCFLHIYRTISSIDPTNAFRPPRFQLFQKIKKRFNKGHSALFKNILITFKGHIIEGGIVTCIFVFFNLLVPELIKMFMHFMHGGHSQKNQVTQASGFIRNLVGVQILRIVFGQHARRIFHQLAIKVQSTLAKMLVQKSLNLAQKARRDIPQSEILQLQNVDLKLVFTMMNNMMFIFEAPLTIVVAIIMLFVENRTYGFIGVYWFLIAFLLHRQLDEKMTHCNATKLGLIDKRSKANYEMLLGMKEAKMIGWQDVMIQKNNDLFQVQNHDHYLFYFYSSLYDIILLMLPVLVVVTICVVDVGEAQPISVEQVYLMLSLLGICYEPMKEFRTISISFHDGLHSLGRIQEYFDMPQQTIDHKFISNQIQEGHLIIQKDTAATFPRTVFDFYVKTKFQMQLHPGDRLIILGRKGQGGSSFIGMINGFMQKIQGQVKINGKKACKTENFFFTKSTVKQNIIFYNQGVSQQQIEQVCQQLQITQQLKSIGGLANEMQDINLYSKSLLQRISLARVICSGAQIYMLDRPFQQLQPRHQVKVQHMLRNKQKNFNVLILITDGQLLFGEDNDKIAIIENGVIEQYDDYEKLIVNTHSNISSYFRSKQEKQLQKSPLRKKLGSPMMTKNKLKEAIRKVSAMNKAVKGASVLIDLVSTKHLKPQSDVQAMKRSFRKSTSSENIDKLMVNFFNNKNVLMVEQKKISKKDTLLYLKQFVFSVPLIQILFIMLIIACAELLHVFIHYWIGHLQEEHGDNSYLNFRSMIIIEVVLTLGLASVLFYQGQVSSQIAIIQGNTMYKKSLFSLILKRISFFISQYPIKIADRFNHDYQQVFIACHGLLTIYKNFVMLIVTVAFISSDGFTGLIFFTVVFLLYASIYIIFRKAQSKIISNYYDYKYGFVKCFQEGLQGAEYFTIFNSKGHLIKRAEAKYRRLASYKLAQKYTNHGLSIACDIMGNILLASIVYYGLQMKIHHTRANIALIATSIHLLMNGSQVLKNILKQTINFQTFFNINLIPFLEMNQKQTKKQQKTRRFDRPQGHQIKFDGVCLCQPGEIISNPISLRIRQGQHVLLYDTNQSFRNLLLYSLTKNINISQANVQKPKNQTGTLEIGKANIDNIDPQQISKIVGVILSKNFYFTGTLRDNLIRKIKVDEQEVAQYISLLKLDQDLDDYDLFGLQTKIHFDNSKVNYELTKKFALMRILLYRSKIVIIKDTTTFLGTISIVDILRKYIPQCTIIKISNKPQAAFGVDRIVHFENSMLLQDGAPKQLIAKPTSIMGSLLKDLNFDDYLFKQQVSRAKIATRFRKKHY